MDIDMKKLEESFERVVAASLTDERLTPIVSKIATGETKRIVETPELARKAFGYYPPPLPLM